MRAQDIPCSEATLPVTSPDSVEQYSNLIRFTIPRLDSAAQDLDHLPHKARLKETEWPQLSSVLGTLRVQFFTSYTTMIAFSLINAYHHCDFPWMGTTVSQGVTSTVLMRCCLKDDEDLSGL